MNMLFDIEKLKVQIFSIQDQIAVVNTTADTALTNANLAINTITNSLAFVAPFTSSTPPISVTSQTFTIPSFFGHGNILDPTIINFEFQIGSKLTYYHVLNATDAGLDESEVVNFTTLRRFVYGISGSGGALSGYIPNTGGVANGNYVFQTGTVTFNSDIVLSGNTTTGTPSSGSNITNKTYVDNSISTLSATIPGTVSTQILSYNYAPLASPNFTGTPTTPTQSLSDNSTTLVNSAWVKGQNYLSALAISPVVALTDATTITIDASASNNFSLNITTSSTTIKTLAAPSSPTNGQIIKITITHTDNINVYLKYDPIYIFIDGSSGLLTQPSGTTNKLSDVIYATYDSVTSKWYARIDNNYREQKTVFYKKDYTSLTTAGTTNGFRAIAEFSFPYGIGQNLVDNGIVIADKSNHTIRQIRQIDNTSNNGQVTTIVGTAGVSGSTGTLLDLPLSIVNYKSLTPAGFYVLQGDFTIIKWDNTSTLTRMAGQSGSSGTTDGIGTAARFTNLKDGVSDSSGNLFVIDGNAIRKMDNTGNVTTFAGNIVTGGNTDGTGTGASFNNPTSITIDSSDNLYLIETNGSINQIRKITSSAVTSTLCSVGSITGQCIRIDNYGDIYILCSTNGTLYKLNMTSLETTQVIINYKHEPELQNINLIEPFSLLRNDLDYSTYNINVNAGQMFFDINNNLFISDTGNNKIIFASSL